MQMDGANWRDAGRKHEEFARRYGLSEPLVRAVLAVYCELRHQAAEDGSKVQAMNRLSSMLDKHQNALHRTRGVDG
ncbi:hypothetical protein [Pseudonocardia sp. DLS-67]